MKGNVEIKQNYSDHFSVTGITSIQLFSASLFQRRSYKCFIVFVLIKYLGWVSDDNIPSVVLFIKHQLCQHWVSGLMNSDTNMILQNKKQKAISQPYFIVFYYELTIVLSVINMAALKYDMSWSCGGIWINLFTNEHMQPWKKGTNQ